jgi:hypothetical protein
MKPRFALLVLAAAAAASSAEAWMTTTTTTTKTPRHRFATAGTLPTTGGSICRTKTWSPLYSSSSSSSSNDDDDANEEEWSDFEDLGFGGKSGSSSGGGGESSPIRSEMDKVDENDIAAPQPNFAKMLQERTGAVDNTAIQTRQFSLGQDLVLSDYVGNMGFDEVTDWEYYYPSEDDDERKVVQPNPFDSSK